MLSPLLGLLSLQQDYYHMGRNNRMAIIRTRSPAVKEIVASAGVKPTMLIDLQKHKAEEIWA